MVEERMSQFTMICLFAFSLLYRRSKPSTEYSLLLRQYLSHVRFECSPPGRVTDQLCESEHSLGSIDGKRANVYVDDDSYFRQYLSSTKINFDYFAQSECSRTRFCNWIIRFLWLLRV